MSATKLPRVSAFMDTVVPTLAPDLDIRDAVSFLVDNRVTGAPVIAPDGTVVGILTEKDCLRLLSIGEDADVANGKVEHFMTRAVVTAPPHMDIYYAAGLFLKNHFRRLPVVQDGRLVGAITRFDILRAIQRNLK